MNEITYSNGPRIEDGINFDADIVAGHPRVQHRSITNPVSDGSLGKYGYAPGQKNKDNSDL